MHAKEDSDVKLRSMTLRSLFTKICFTGIFLVIAVSAVYYIRNGSEAKPDVIMIVIDTLRRDRLGCYGNADDTSPYIDDLARVATKYDTARSHASWTTPAIASILTSRYPWQLGITNRASKLPLEATTLAETLSGSGYQTAAVFSAVHLGATTQFDQGFGSCLQESTVYDGSPASSVTDRGIEFIDLNKGKDKPLFLFLHYFDPHAGYVTHDGHWFVDSSLSCTPEDYDPSMKWPQLIQQKEHFATNENARTCLTGTYDSEVAWTDAQIGRVIDKLKASGRFENALIVVTGDHGEEFLDHKGLGHGHTLYKELINVPLLVKAPHQNQGRVVKEPVTHTDVLPTVLSMLEIDLPKDAVGISLTSENLPLKRPLISETTLYRSHFRSVIFGRYKLIQDLKSGSKMLFDFEADPHERNDLSETRLAEVKKLSSLMAIATGTRSSSADKAVFTADEVELLHSLGYVE